MQFTLEEIRRADQICFPEDFARLIETHSNLSGQTFQDKTLLGFIKEYGSNPEMLAVAEKMIASLLRQPTEVMAIRSATFLGSMREYAIRAILAEEDKKFLAYINQPIPQPAIVFVPIPGTSGTPRYSISMDQRTIQMGEGEADITSYQCEVHGLQPHIGGYNQGGHDGMGVCLKCCAAIYAAWLARDVTPEQKAGDGKIQSSEQ